MKLVLSIITGQLETSVAKSGFGRPEQPFGQWRALDAARVSVARRGRAPALKGQLGHTLHRDLRHRKRDHIPPR